MPTDMTPDAPVRAPLEQLLTWRLIVTGRLVRTFADQQFGDLAGGGQACAVLMRLAQFNGVTQAELARRQRVEAPTMCRMVDRLERDGLVTRRRHPADRRALRVILTEDGRQAVARHEPTVAHIEQRVLDVLDEEERCTLSTLLGKVMDAMEEGA